MEPPMHGIVKSVLLARAALSAAIFAAMFGEVRADAISFLGLPFQQAPSVQIGGVTISGSNDVVVNPPIAPDGLSILGGIPGFAYRSGTIDSTESITFHFDSGPVANVVLLPQSIGTIGNTPLSAEGESLITAFGAGGQSLGTLDFRPLASPNYALNISAAFANQPISSFQFQPEGDAVNGNFAIIAGLNFSAIPEPSSLLGCAMGILVAIRYASRRRAPRPSQATRGPSFSVGKPNPER
jgi:hypothetical protein